MTPKRADWRDALRRVPLHLWTFGVVYFATALLVGRYAVVAAVAISARGEFDDWWDGSQTLAGALIDFAAQTAAVIPVWWLHHV